MKLKLEQSDKMELTIFPKYQPIEVMLAAIEVKIFNLMELLNKIRVKL